VYILRRRYAHLLTGILMHVHPVLPRIAEASQLQLPRPGPDGQPNESSQLSICARYARRQDYCLFFPSSMSVRCNPAIYFSAKQAPSSASATRTPPTFASPRYHQMLRRLATLST
jgi:hypothetical protein